MRKNANPATKILTAWMALETLSPTIFKKPIDLAGGDQRRLVPMSGQSLPWKDGVNRQIKNCRLFYHIVLGSVRLEPAIEALLKIYSDSRAEKPFVQGESVLAVITVDDQGRPVSEGTAVSSFTWALPVALDGKLGELDSWSGAEQSLMEKLTDLLIEFGDDGVVKPLTLKTLAEARNWLVERLNLPEYLLDMNSFAICSWQHKSVNEPPELVLLNSFFLKDLEKAIELTRWKRMPKLLRRYLGQAQPSNRHNLLTDAVALQQVAEPFKMPPVAWPSPGNGGLALFQQCAVNSALSELKDGELLAVNGPPGTGKTTLLRDIVAAVLTRRAEAMLEFDDPETAFHLSEHRINKGDPQYIQGRNGQLRLPVVIQNENPPNDRAEALARWQTAREELVQTLKAA